MAHATHGAVLSVFARALGGALAHSAIAVAIAIAGEGTALGSRPDIGVEYFQQGVSYHIDCRLHTPGDSISGTIELRYCNQSPDTLDAVWFHLIQNAYRPGSHLDHWRRSQGDFSIRDLAPQKAPACRVRTIADGEGTRLAGETDDTLLRVPLARPLAPGGVEMFRYDFVTTFGGMPHRMAKGDDYYIAAHWYPRMVVYDRERGWNLDYHVGFEFYGDFGTYDWSLTLPANQIVEGTGVLLNEAEVLPSELRARLELTHFADHEWGLAASELLPGTAETRTWRFHADDVHNVAWVASPNFRIGEVEWEGVRVIALAREQHAARWQDAAESAARMVADFSRRFGRYRYPKMVVADVKSGMEYPMLTADGGRSPWYLGLFAHEIGHNWYYGQVGSNETHRAFLDEGFTNYISSVTMDSLWGSGFWSEREGWYRRRFGEDVTDKYFRNDQRYLSFVRAGYERDALENRSDQFDEYQSYRMVYQKTASMLFALEGVLGDAVFARIMNRYFERFVFQHPNERDFQRVAEEVSGLDLEWFFHAWQRRTDAVDYAVVSLRNLSTLLGNRAAIELERRAPMAMPIDIELELADGSRRWVLVPTAEGPMKSPPGWTIAPRWVGSGRWHPRFAFELATDQPVRRVRIDPSGRLPDRNRLDNQSGSPPIRLRYDPGFPLWPSVDAYDLLARPTVRWNGPDGLRPGLRLAGGYLLTDFTRAHHIEVAARLGLRSRQPEGSFFWETPLPALGRLTHVALRYEDADGQRNAEGSVEWIARARLYERPFHRVRCAVRYEELRDRAYLPRFLDWSRKATTALEGRYRYEGLPGRVFWNQRLEAALTSGLFEDRPSWTTLELASMRSFLGASLRVYGGLREGDPPAERAIHLFDAPSSEIARAHWLYRSRDALPGRLDVGRVHHGGGANLRGFGFEDRVVSRVAALSIERPIPFLARIVPDRWEKVHFDAQPLWPAIYLFTDAAIARTEDSDETRAADFGIGVHMPFVFVPSGFGRYGLRVDWPVALHDSRRSWRRSGKCLFGLQRAWE